MSCDACIIGADDICNEFYEDTERRARVPHACCECDRTIQPGEMYTRSVGKSEGEVWAYKTCALCSEVRPVFYCEGAWIFGDLWSEMEQQAFPELTTASPCFRELSPAAKTLVMDRWRAWKGIRARA